jgi:hypothetical protein
MVVGLLAAAAAAPGLAGAAPTPLSPPTIDGTVRFGQTVTCRPGAWNSGGLTFTYRWLLGGGPILQGPARTPAEGPVLALTDPSLMNGNSLSCQVTATDAQGAATRATSATQRPEPGRTTMRITKVTPLPKGRVRIQGRIGPPVAVRAPWGEDDLVVVRRRIGPGRYLQLSRTVRVAANGRFTVVATDRPAGRKRISIDYSSGESSFWSDVSATRTVRFSAGGGNVFGGSVRVGG